MAHVMTASGSCRSYLAIQYLQQEAHSPYSMSMIFFFDGLHVFFQLISLFLYYPFVHIVPFLVVFSAPLDLWVVYEP